MKKFTLNFLTIILVFACVGINASADTIDTPPSKNNVTRLSEDKLHIIYKNKYGEIIGEEYVSKGSSQNLPHSTLEIPGYINPYFVFIPLDKVVNNEYIIVYEDAIYYLDIIAVDEKGKELKRFEFTGKYNEKKTITLPDYSNYTPLNKTFEYTFKEHKEMTVLYEFKTFTINFFFQDSIDNEVIGNSTVIGKYGSRVTIPFPEIEGYHHLTDSIEQIILGNDFKFFPYYRKDITLNIQYRLEDGTLMHSDSLTQLYKTDYSIEPKSFFGYEISESSLPLEGTMPAKDSEIKINLVPKTLTNTIRYYNDLGEIVLEKPIVGKYLDYVDVDLPEIEGYNKPTQNETYQLTEFDKFVDSSHVYQRKSINITTNYVLDNGDIIHNTKKSQLFNSNYTIVPEDLYGYNLNVENVILSGKTPSEDFVVSIPVTPKKISSTLQFKDELGNVIYEQAVNGFYNDLVQIELPIIAGYNELDSKIIEYRLVSLDEHIVSNIVYFRKDINIQLNYKLKDGTIISNQQSVVKFKDIYKFILELPKNYHLVEILDISKLEGIAPDNDISIDLFIEPNKEIPETPTSGSDIGPIIGKNNTNSEITDSPSADKFLPSTGVTSYLIISVSVVILGTLLLVLHKIKKEKNTI